MPNTIRVLIVDDSAFVRRSLARIVTTDPRLEVAGFAADGNEAVAKVRELRPDVVTMDVMMPRMDGIEAVRRLMNTDPVPILMVSSYTEKGAAYTVEALSLGAIDCVLKPERSVSLDLHLITEELIAKLLLASRIRPVRNARIGEEDRRRNSASAAKSTIQRRPRRWSETLPESAEPILRFIALGSSTGGPAVLRRLLALLAPDFPLPLAIVQHITPSFFNELVAIFDRVCPLTVKRAEEGESALPGRVYLAAPRSHLVVDERRRFRLRTGEPVSGHLPSASVLIESAARVYGTHAAGIILSGMGDDGAAGMKHLAERGGRVYVQDEASSVVYGMPKAVLDAGVNAVSVPAAGLPHLFQRLCELAGNL